MSNAKIQSKSSTKKSIVSDKFNDMPTIKKVDFVKSLIEFHLADKRIISIPLKWIDKLKKATKEQREKYAIRGHFVFWDEIDEIIGVKNLLNGSIIPNS